MFRIYKDDEIVVEGESPLTIIGIEPNTDIEKGEYQAVRVEDDKESERVNIPEFATLTIETTGVSVSPQTSSAKAGEAGSRQLTAAVTPSDATNKSVSYAIAPSADGLSVNDGGNITWTEDTPSGEYTTTVKTNDGGYTATHVLMLEEPKEGD